MGSISTQSMTTAISLSTTTTAKSLLLGYRAYFQMGLTALPSRGRMGSSSEAVRSVSLEHSKGGICMYEYG